MRGLRGGGGKAYSCFSATVSFAIKENECAEEIHFLRIYRRAKADKLRAKEKDTAFFFRSFRRLEYNGRDQKRTIMTTSILEPHADERSL